MFGSWPIATNRPSAGTSQRLVGLRAAQAQRLDLLVADDLLDDLGVEDEVELVVRLGAVDHDPRGAELVAAVHEVDARRELRQEERLLER